MVILMKREQDNTIIVVVTMEGVMAAEPGFKGRCHGYSPGYSPRGGKGRKLREKYATDPPNEQMLRNDRWTVAHSRKGGCTGTRVVWNHLCLHLGFAGVFVVCCVYQRGRRLVSEMDQACIVNAQSKRLYPWESCCWNPT